MSTEYIIWTTLGFAVATITVFVSLALAASDSEDREVSENRTVWSWIQLFVTAVVVLCMIGSAVTAYDTVRDVERQCPVERK